MAADRSGSAAAFHTALAAGDQARAIAPLAPEVVIYEGGQVERSRDGYASSHLAVDIDFARSSTRKVLKETECVDCNTAVVWEGLGHRPCPLALAQAEVRMAGARSLAAPVRPQTLKSSKATMPSSTPSSCSIRRVAASMAGGPHT